MKVYGVELSFNNKQEIIQLPINPSSIDVDNSGNSKTYEVSGLGEVNVIKDRKLTEYSFSGLFPAQWYPFVTTDKLLHPVEYIKMIEGWMATKRPIRFIFVSDTYDINTPVSIEAFPWKEIAGSGGDIEFSLKLKQYVFYAAKKITKKPAATLVKGKAAAPVAKVTRPNDKQQPKTYKLVAGDTLWIVAAKQLGNGDLWKSIQKINGIKDSELKNLKVGRVLKLP